MPYKDKADEAEYQRGIPIELKRIYEQTYLMTEKGKAYKIAKNRRYRERVLILNPPQCINAANATKPQSLKPTQQYTARNVRSKELNYTNQNQYQ